MIYVTADQHFNHWAIVKYCQRPFLSTADMNAAMIRRWNMMVGQEDIVFHLGDFILGTNVEETSRILNALRGSSKVLVRGNHDGTMTRLNRVGFNAVCDRMSIVFHKLNILMVHNITDATAWDYHNHDIVLFGQSHNGWMGEGKFVNVGVDSPMAGFGPIPLINVVDQKLMYG